MVSEDRLDEVFAGHAVSPMTAFADWFRAATQSEPDVPEAFCLATADPDGLPAARIVLMKDHDGAGIVFYTNTHSAKGTDLAANPVASACFFWKSLDRQIRLTGPVAPVSAAEADAYFASRPRESRISACASQQSRPLADPADFAAAIRAVEARFGDGPVARPDHWSGYRLRPRRVEFWRGRASRRHDRILFSRDAADTGGWQATSLYP